MAWLGSVLEPRFFSSSRWWLRGAIAGTAFLAVLLYFFLATPVGTGAGFYPLGLDNAWDPPPRIYDPGFLLAGIIFGPDAKPHALWSWTVWTGSVLWFFSLGFLVGALCRRLWAVVMVCALLFLLTAALIGFASIFPWYRGHAMEPPTPPPDPNTRPTWGM